MELIRQLFETLVHLSPASVNTLAEQAGPWLYVILFLIIFAETGLVATPFLPGDSLLFAVGAVPLTRARRSISAHDRAPHCCRRRW